MKIKLKSQNENNIVFLKGKEEQQISLSEIKAIKRRKFSIGKTVGLVPIALVTIAVGGYIIGPSINFPSTYESPN